uniref:Uncharacterized protein n=1 Tax=Arundo donax TaxID=35708 RepID=A0A0A9HXU8_ARUDO
MEIEEIANEEQSSNTSCDRCTGVVVFRITNSISAAQHYL